MTSKECNEEYIPLALRPLNITSKEALDNIYNFEANGDFMFREINIIKKDLEVLNILRKHLKQDFDGEDYVISFNINDCRHREDFDKVWEWLENGENK